MPFCLPQVLEQEVKERSNNMLAIKTRQLELEDRHGTRLTSGFDMASLDQRHRALLAQVSLPVSPLPASPLPASPLPTPVVETAISAETSSAVESSSVAYTSKER